MIINQGVGDVGANVISQMYLAHSSVVSIKKLLYEHLGAHLYVGFFQMLDLTLEVYLHYDKKNTWRV